MRMQLPQKLDITPQGRYAVFERTRQIASGLIQYQPLFQSQNAAGWYQNGQASDQNLLTLCDSLPQIVPLLTSAFDGRTSRPFCPLLMLSPGS
ncbi:MAG: hypothetical protein DMG97_23240 [Acidobacteria bacterium]|nr:MAG: hypothetical protein DMG97_23240 [Acidobacteriota bacterium]PYV74441.1 MAG: hypothetical protein DMG96_20135 [Acidobacteriota bacterium]